MDVPDHLSLEHLRGTGLQPGEKAQPEVSALSCIMHLQHLDAEDGQALSLGAHSIPWSTWHLATCKRFPVVVRKTH